MTATQHPSVVAALFTEENQAQEAVDALLQAGFTGDQIGFAGHGTPHGLLASIKSLFRKDPTSMPDVYNDLVEAGLPEQVAQYYRQEYNAGRSIVEVVGAGDTQAAITTLSQYGGYGAPRGEKTAGAAPQQPMTDTEGEQRLRLREEQLQVGKQPTQTGAAGLRKEVVGEQRSMDVPVTHEEAYVERRSGSGQPSDTPIGEEETYRVPLHEEQVSVSKQPVEKEEIALGKRQVQRAHHVDETVRHEEAHVEREGDVPFQNQEDDSQS